MFTYLNFEIYKSTIKHPQNGIFIWNLDIPTNDISLRRYDSGEKTLSKFMRGQYSGTY